MEFELENKSNDELREMAKKLDLTLHPALGREKIIDAIDKALIKRREKLKAEAVAELRAEADVKLGTTKAGIKPSPETIAIENSKKVYVIFHNLENPGSDGQPGADITFLVGEKFRFHLFHGKKHILPECLVSEKKEDAWISRAQICTRPTYEDRKLPTGQRISVKVGSERRFLFNVVGPAPDSAEFGVVFDEDDKE